MRIDIGYTDENNELEKLLFERHTHAEIANDHEPDQIVYTEKDVLDIIEWVLKNADRVRDMVDM